MIPHVISPLRLALLLLLAFGIAEPSIALRAQVWRDVSGASPTAPPAGESAAMAYDFARGSFVLFGGATASGVLTNETWEWVSDTVGWQQVSFPPNAVLPRPRRGAAMTYDLARGLILLFGGRTIGNVESDETWTFDGNTWTQLFPTTSPSPRAFMSMARDPSTLDVVLFGGIGGIGGAGFGSNETWVWNGTTWAQVATTGTVPSGRYNQAMGSSSTGVIMMGGESATGGTQPAALWEFSGGRWSSRQSFSQPLDRTQHALFDLPVSGGPYVYGGRSQQVQALDDTWAFRASGWNPIDAPVTPGPRRAMAYATSAAGFGLLFGGNTGTDTWVLEGFDVPDNALPIGLGNWPGQPRLVAQRDLRIGNTFDVDLLDLPWAATNATLWTGFSDQRWGPAPLPLLIGPLAPGASVFLSLDFSNPMVPPTDVIQRNAYSLSVALPNDPSIVGIRLFQQASATLPSGLRVSNAIALTIQP